MGFNIKAFILSALVLPGLGQLYKGDRLKGILLILLVNLFLLAALFLILRSIGPLVAASYLSAPLESARLVEQLQAQSPAARWLLGGFLAVWAYAAVDAAVDKGKTSSTTSTGD